MGKCEIIRYIDRDFKADEDEVAEEYRVSVCVNGTEVSGLMALPAELEELALGFLFSECRIEKPSDVTGVTLDTGSFRVDVTVNNTVKVSGDGVLSTVTSGCGRNVSQISSLHADSFKPISPKAHHLATDVTDAVRLLSRHSGLFKDTGGVHTVGLRFDNDFKWVCDDIGRHNAFDKVIGHALRQKKWPLPDDAMIVSTGRISSDIVLKTIRSGIPVLVSRSAPTENAIRLAETYGVTLVGFARGERFNIYSHAYRIRKAKPDNS